jgi:hypothetical protein
VVATFCRAYPAYRAEDVLAMPYFRFHALWLGAELPSWLALSAPPAPASILDLHEARLAKARRVKAQIAAQRAGTVPDGSG